MGSGRRTSIATQGSTLEGPSDSEPLFHPACLGAVARLRGGGPHQALRARLQSRGLDMKLNEAKHGIELQFRREK